MPVATPLLPPQSPFSPGPFGPPVVRPQPRLLPAPSPLTVPLTIPAVIAALLLEVGRRQFCPIGERVAMRKPFKRSEPENKRRQRPCTGGKAIRKRNGFRRKKIGRFHMQKAEGIGVVPLSSIVRSHTIRVARLRGYKTSGEANTIIESTIDIPRTARERIISRVIPDVCFYQVWAKTPKSTCICPDGSPCRKTVRENEEG